MAQAEAGVHYAPSLKQRLRYADSAIYAQDAALVIEPSGLQHISVVAQSSRDAVSVAAIMSLREAVKARRALTRTIRTLRARQAELAS